MVCFFLSLSQTGTSLLMFLYRLLNDKERHRGVKPLLCPHLCVIVGGGAAWMVFVSRFFS
jgi:hypothetical protein